MIFGSCVYGFLVTFRMPGESFCRANSLRTMRHSGRRAHASAGVIDSVLKSTEPVMKHNFVVCHSGRADDQGSIGDRTDSVLVGAQNLASPARNQAREYLHGDSLFDEPD
jgi:hypothetical protein